MIGRLIFISASPTEGEEEKETARLAAPSFQRDPRTFASRDRASARRRGIVSSAGETGFSRSEIGLGSASVRSTDMIDHLPDTA